MVNISDDILIFAETIEEHDAILDKVLQRLQDYGLTVNKDKCEFRTEELIFFGMRFSKNGISIDPAKLDAIKTAKPPTNSEEVRSFLGLCSYVSTFIKEFATITAPLWQLTKSSVKWEWNDTHLKAFETLKTELTTEARAYFIEEWETRLICDASNVGLGALLVQINPEDRKEIKIIDSCSRLLSPTEKKYSTIEKEGLGVVWACERFHLYLYGAEFEIVTDSKAIELILRNPNSKPPVRIQRWALGLSRQPVEDPAEDESVEIQVNTLTSTLLPQQ